MTSAAQAAVVRLEKALGALDDADVAAGTAECVGTCVLWRIASAELFLERAGKRLANADSNILQAEEALKEARMQRVRRQEELEAGQASLETLRTESTSSFGLHSHPMSGGGSDQGAQITSLQQMSTSCKRSEMRSRRGCRSKKGVQNHWGGSHGCGKILWSTQWKSWCSGCTPGSRK